ncbi:hypothetical protein [Streptomyces sp. NPDC018833]|uniref:hypothetical protein n=1 Tax=Streptomyces sp. NPDC018833 TaxID=3365053 RepID=UPI003797B0F2
MNPRPLGTWSLIMVCSLLLWTRCEDCRAARARYQLSEVTDAQDQLLMCAGKRAYSTTVLYLPLAVAAPVGGCFVARRRVDTIPSAAAAADSGFGA